MAKLKPFIYSFTGPQGSGKGTQASLIKKQFNTPFVVTGDIIRAEIAKRTNLGKKAAELINKGNIVTLEIWQSLMGEYLKSADLSAGLLLDGSPRNLEQAEALEGIIAQKNLPSVKIIYLKIERSTATKRLIKRRICPIGQESLTTDFCDEHQVKTITRDDDTPKAIDRRLDLYFEQTHPIIDFYRKKGNEIIEINGQQSIEKVNKDLIKELRKRDLIND